MTVADRLGFGCASLFGLPTSRERRGMLEAAYDGGLRHFDVAPIYGLGRAEVELGDFAAAHPDVRIATKFGLELTTVGRALGFVQSPARRVLRRASGLRRHVKRSGAGPSAGSVGNTLYRADHSVATARRSLSRSLRLLRRPRVDYLLLHEPADVPAAVSQGLYDFLDEEMAHGRVGAWGPAGESQRGTPELRRRAQVVQQPYHLGDPPPEPGGSGRREVVTFGFLSRALPALADRLASDRRLRDDIAETARLEVDDLPGLLLRDALASTGGRVLISTTRRAHLTTLLAQAQSPTPEDAACIALLRTAMRDGRR